MIKERHFVPKEKRMELSQALQDLLVLNGFSRKTLSSQIGVSIDMICNWCRCGNIPGAHLTALAGALKMKEEDILALGFHQGKRPGKTWLGTSGPSGLGGLVFPASIFEKATKNMKKLRYPNLSVADFVKLLDLEARNHPPQG